MLIVEEKALHCRDEARNHDKIWASCHSSSGIYLSIWGRRDSKYQTKTKSFGNLYLAQQEFNKLVREKLGKGYREVAFADPRHGNIPSFGNHVNQPGTNRNLVTSESLLADLELFTATLAGAGTDGLVLVEEDSLRLQFAQLKLKTEVMLLDLSEGQSQRHLKAYSQKMQKVFLELDSGPLNRANLLKKAEARSFLDLE